MAKQWIKAASLLIDPDTGGLFVAPQAGGDPIAARKAWSEAATLSFDANGALLIRLAAPLTLDDLADLVSGKIIVGDESDRPAAVALTGDVTMSNAGITAIGAGRVTDGMLASRLVKNAAVPAQVCISTFQSFVDGDTITLTDGATVTEIYEFDADNNLTAGHIRVDISANPPWTAFIATLAANSALARAKFLNADMSARIALIALTAGTVGNAYTVACSAHGVRDSATFSGGTNAAVLQAVTVNHTVIAQEASEGVIAIGLPFNATLVLVTYRTAAGAHVTDITVDTTATNTVIIYENVVAWAAGDSLLVYALG